MNWWTKLKLKPGRCRSAIQMQNIDFNLQKAVLAANAKALKQE
jgi:hypothetical protein